MSAPNALLSKRTMTPNKLTIYCVRPVRLGISPAMIPGGEDGSVTFDSTFGSALRSCWAIAGCLHTVGLSFSFSFFLPLSVRVRVSGSLVRCMIRFVGSCLSRGSDSWRHFESERSSAAILSGCEVFRFPKGEDGGSVLGGN